VGFSASEKFFKNIFFDFELDYLKSVFFVQALFSFAKSIFFGKPLCF